MPVGKGVWRVWRVLEGLEGCSLGPGVPDSEVALALGCLLGKVFGGFGMFAGWQTAALKVNRKHCCGLGLGCLLGKVCGGFGGFWRVWTVLEGFGGFAGWQTAALKANRKPLLWP